VTKLEYDPLAQQLLSASVRRLRITVTLATSSLVLAAGFGWHSERVWSLTLTPMDLDTLEWVGPMIAIFHLIGCLAGVLIARSAPRALYRWVVRRVARPSMVESQTLSYRVQPTAIWAMGLRARTILEVAYFARIFGATAVLWAVYYVFGLHLASPPGAVIFGAVAILGSLFMVRRERPTVDGLVSELLDAPREGTLRIGPSAP
jgi:hypothetical protein